MTSEADAGMTALPSLPSEPAALPPDVRRLVVYVVWDRRGDVEDYVTPALAGLREHAQHILVVVNGRLTAQGRGVLEPICDDILVRENVGFDIWAHKDALDHVGARIADFDEVLLTNDTWFGPVRPYAPVFDRMAAAPVHFWGMTDHSREEPNPFTGEGVLYYHLQSFWIAVRREMFLSDAWRSYWRELPEMPGYFDAVLKHETVFTEHFASRGYAHGVAFPSADYPTDHPALFNPDLLMDAGCPILKRRPFFHYPPFLDRNAVIGRHIIRHAGRYGYPVQLIWRDLARNVPPKTLNADAGMLEVLPEVAARDRLDPPVRIAAVAHVTERGALEEVSRRIALLPTDTDVFFTTPDANLAEQIEAALAEPGPLHAWHSQVRIVPGGRGGDMAAFFVGCRDVLRPGTYDLVAKIHTRVPRRRGATVARYFRRYQLDNLLSSRGYIGNVLGLFHAEPGLGAVFPPTIHIGYAIFGDGWGPYRDAAEKLAKRLRIRVPFDGATPLAPFGGMWIARPEAMEILSAQPWEYDDYERTLTGGADLARVQERLLAQAAGERGFHCRTVLNAEHAALSHSALEYKLDQLASTTPGYPLEQIQFLHRAGRPGRGSGPDFVRMYLRMNHPGILRLFNPVFQLARGTFRLIRRGPVALRDQADGRRR